MSNPRIPAEGQDFSDTGQESAIVHLPAEQVDAVRAHLDEILASPQFRKSRRLQDFLRFIVQWTLEGRASELKERVIGAEVYGREASYDTAEDHTVRVAASDLRRRLAQYYLEHGGHSPIRIELHPGSYVPQFRFNGVESAPPGEGEPPAGAELGRPAPRLWRAVKAHPRVVLTALGVVILAVVALALSGKIGWGGAGRQSVLREFWRPLSAGDGRVLVCVGEAWQTRSANQPAIAVPQKGTALGPVLRSSSGIIRQLFHATDAVAGATVSGILSSLDLKPFWRSDTTTTLTELKESPAVYVGLLNNVWSRRLMEQMRFRVTWDNPQGQAAGPAIIDYGNSERRVWAPALAGANPDPVKGEGIVRDYAIVARLRDPQTGQPVVLLGGILGYGTLAASEFLNDGESLRALLKAAPPGWGGNHLEAVVAVDIVNGVPGRPRLVSAHFR